MFGDFRKLEGLEIEPSGKVFGIQFIDSFGKQIVGNRLVFVLVTGVQNPFVL